MTDSPNIASPAQVRLVVIRCGEVAPGDAARHAMVHAVTLGRTSSASELARSEVEQVLTLCEVIAAGHAVVGAGGVTRAMDGRPLKLPLDPSRTRAWLAGNPAAPVMPTPTLPREGTDAYAMLGAMMDAWPDPIWDANARLRITAHSRAAELRANGWEVSSVREADETHPKGARWGYRLDTHPDDWYPATRRSA